MNSKVVMAVLILIVAVALSSFVAYNKGYDAGYDAATATSSGYEACVAAGNPVAMSDPPQCHDDKGTHYGPQ